MSRRAWLFILIVLSSGLALLLASFPVTPLPFSQWLTWATLTLLAIITQLTKPDGHNHANQTYYASPIFFFAGVVLLHPFLLILLIIVPHAVEWGWARLSHSEMLLSWYIQPFNIAKHIIAATTAYLVFTYTRHAVIFGRPVQDVWGVIFASLVFVGLNQAIVGLVLYMVRGVSWRKSGLFDPQNLLTESILTMIGYGAARFWQLEPWLIIPAVAPVLLIYRALMVPQLKEEAQTDGKTGLFNARYFNKVFAEEITRAQRFNRPVSFIMADLDLLRNINNTYGHLAGDIVLEGIGRIIRATVREYDIAGRFGGEEFAIMLPETEVGDALGIAERVRETIEQASFVVTTSVEPIKATMSFGVACFPHDATSALDLNQEADVALYQAKLQGRNRVIYAGDVPHSIKLEHNATAARAAAEYSAGFVQRRPAGDLDEGQVIVPTIARTMAPNELLRDIVGEAGDSDSVPAPQRRKTDAATAPEPNPLKLWAFLALVTGGALITGSFGFITMPHPNFAAIAVLASLAGISELLQISVYGETTVSVSLTFMFAAALVSGIPGAAIVSITISLADQLRQRRPAKQSYKMAFNAATHLFAAITPALLSTFGLIQSFRWWHLLPLAGAAGLYYLIETSLISMAIGLSTNKSIKSIWRSQFQWLAPHYVTQAALGALLAFAYVELNMIGVMIIIAPVLMMRLAQKQYVDRTQTSVRELQRMNRELAAANHEIVSANQTMAQVNDELYLTLAKVFDARDPYVGNHATKVADYAVAIATELGLPPDRVEVVRRAGYLHDIGKIAIPEAILNKPSKLTTEEFELMKSHAALGAEFLETSHGLRYLAPFVRYHHERWDGQGYPDQLHGEQIPLESRILNVCDSVEAMASDRPYHTGMSFATIVAEVERCSGTQFDPHVAETFIRIADREGARFIVNSALEVGRRSTTRSANLLPTPHLDKLAATASL